MTNALRLRRRILVREDSGIDEDDTLVIQEHERWFDVGYEPIPVLDPLTAMGSGLTELLASFPLTAYTTGPRTNVPTLALNDIAISGIETMPTLVTNIEPTSSTGA